MAFGLATTVIACGGHGAQKPVSGATVEKRTPANPVAVSRMAQGVQAMKDRVPARAIELRYAAIASSRLPSAR